MPDPWTVIASMPVGDGLRIRMRIEQADHCPPAGPPRHDDAAPDPGESPILRVRAASVRYTPPGARTALIFVCLSFTPSLPPRTALVLDEMIWIPFVTFWQVSAGFR